MRWSARYCRISSDGTSGCHVRSASVARPLEAHASCQGSARDVYGYVTHPAAERLSHLPNAALLLSVGFLVGCAVERLNEPVYKRLRGRPRADTAPCFACGIASARVIGPLGGARVNDSDQRWDFPIECPDRALHLILSESGTSC